MTISLFVTLIFLSAFASLFVLVFDLFVFLLFVSVIFDVLALSSISNFLLTSVKAAPRRAVTQIMMTTMVLLTANGPPAATTALVMEYSLAPVLIL